MREVINRDKLIREVCEDTGFPRRTVAPIVDNALSNITFFLANGHDVKIQGFGAFVMKKRAPRTGRNPHTGEAVPIPARYVPTFIPSEEMKRVSVKPLWSLR